MDIMKKQFTFTVEGQKHSFDTVDQMWGGIYELRDQGIEIDRQSIKIEEVKQFGKIKLSFAKYESRDAVTDEVEYRSLDVVLEATDFDTLYAVVEIMEKELGESFCRCPWEHDGKYTICDVLSLPYEHGFMKEIKDNAKYAFKLAKQQLGIK